MTSVSNAEIRSDRLFLDGIPLSIERHSPSDLSMTLRLLGRDAITRTIEQLYAAKKQSSPDRLVSHQPIIAMELGRNKKDLLTAFGQRNFTHQHRSIIEVRYPLREYWSTIVDHDFVPHVVSGMGSRKNPVNRLMLQDPETLPPETTPLHHLPAALGFREPIITPALRPELAEAWSMNDQDTYRSLLSRYEDAGQEVIDAQTISASTNNDPLIARAYAQIGFIIAQAHLRIDIEGDAYLLNPNGYEAALEDAEMSAYQHYEEDINDVLQTELSRIRALRES